MCYSVAASAVKAGFRLRIADIDASSLDFDLERLGNTDFRHVAAIVVTNLYGLPGQLPAIGRIARDNRVFLVDDAAQSLARQSEAGRPADGATLDFSASTRGTPLSAIDAGAVVADSDAIGEALEAGIRRLAGPDVLTRSRHFFTLLAYATLLHPQL